MEIIDVKDMSFFLRAYNNKKRKYIIKIFVESNNSKLVLTDIVNILHLEQSVCSQHMGVLLRANILMRERDVKVIKYYLNETALNVILKMNEVFKELKFTEYE